MEDYSGHRERLRQHFLTHGLDVLRDYEVLELLLFYAIPRRDTQPLARKLLQHFGSIAAVLEASPLELNTVAKLSDNTIALLQLINPMARRYLLSKADTERTIFLRNVKECGQFLLPYFFGETDELIYMLCLDAGNRLLSCRQLERGSVNSVQLPIRKAAEIAIGCHATAVILAHNHPCGMTVPSDSDFKTTELLASVLTPMEITVADHFIISGDSFFSMQENGYI